MCFSERGHSCERDLGAILILVLLKKASGGLSRSSNRDLGCGSTETSLEAVVLSPGLLVTLSYSGQVCHPWGRKRLAVLQNYLGLGFEGNRIKLCYPTFIKSIR